MKKNFFRSVLRRRIIVIVILLMQLVLIGLLLINTGRINTTIRELLYLASIFVVLYVVNKREKGDYRLIWSLQILIFPFFGGMFYLIFQLQGTKKKVHTVFNDWWQKNKAILNYSHATLARARKQAKGNAHLVTYLQSNAGYPVYKSDNIVYLPIGEAKFDYMLNALNEAKSYIYIEYYIIEQGNMWDAILEILISKAKQGLDVRVIYDDMGCFLRLPKDYPKTLESYGIKCAVYGPFRPVLSARQNNRNHRKITVIDGNVAFTGGINLADEYINAKLRFGHWKDTAIMVTGEAAWSFTLMFLQMWFVCSVGGDMPMPKNPWVDFQGDDDNSVAGGGAYVQPYADSPVGDERIGKNVYSHIIGNAQNYLYINTPYLIIDDVIITKLCLAAKSGVDVRIMTPHLPDKKYVHTVTRSFYRELTNAGVRIYEYGDGFLHAKSFVSDDLVATVGTANLDYRSLYLHFECGICIYDEKTAEIMRDDFLSTLDRCVEITGEAGKSGILAQFYQDTLRLLSPLL